MNKVLALACVCATLLFACESTTTTTPEPYKVPLLDSMPSGLSTEYVRITEILVNPFGNDDKTERWTITNFRKDSAVDVNGYYFTDEESKDTTRWTISTTSKLGAQASLDIVSDKNAQLSNNGDTLKFYNPLGKLIQTVGFAKVDSGVVIKVR